MSAALAVEPGPAVVFRETRQDVGRVLAGGSIETRFRFRNGGDAPLRIENVASSCDCLQPRFPATVAPGAEAEVSARFEPQVSWEGKLEKTIRVRTNDPQHPDVELTLAADVIPFFRREPAGPVELSYRPGETFRRTVLLIPRAGSRARRQRGSV